jgi:hypothetical protein
MRKGGDDGRQGRSGGEKIGLPPPPTSPGLVGSGLLGYLAGQLPSPSRPVACVIDSWLVCGSGASGHGAQATINQPSGQVGMGCPGGHLSRAARDFFLLSCRHKKSNRLLSRTP